MGFQKFFQFLIPTFNQNAWIAKLEMASCFTFDFLFARHCIVYTTQDIQMELTFAMRIAVRVRGKITERGAAMLH